MFPRKAIIAGPVCLALMSDPSSNPIEQFTDPLPPAGMLDLEGGKSGVGGKAALTALALHRLGIPARLAGKIGNDRVGETVRENLQEVSRELVRGIVVDLAMNTGVIIRSSTSGTDEEIQYIPGANNTFYASDIPRADLQEVDLFHFTDPAAMRSVYRGEGGELVSILRRARREGLTNSLDFNLPDLTGPLSAVDWTLVLENCLRDVDLLFIDALDLVGIFRRDIYERLIEQPGTPLLETVMPELLDDLSRQVLSRRVKAVLIGLGQGGFYLRTAPEKAWRKAGRALAGFSEAWHDQELWAPAFVGYAPEATDMLTSGFLGSLLRGEDPGKALLMASAVCASKANSTWEDIQAQLDSGWAALSLKGVGEGWRKEGPHGLWRKA